MENPEGEETKRMADEAIEKIAKKLKNINIPIDKIIEVTGLTKEKIKKL